MSKVQKPLLKNIDLNKIREAEVYDYINTILSDSSKCVTLNRLFAEKAMLLSKRETAIVNERLYGLSKYISENLYVFSDFIIKLRTQIIKKKKYKIKLDDCNKVKRYMILSLLEDFKTLGMIGEFTYDANTNVVAGKFTDSKEFFAYINGGFYEDYAYCEAKNVLDELSQAYGVDYELYRNVYVHIPIGNKNVETREIDLLIRFDDRAYIIEVKSGANHKVRNYYTLRMRLGIDAFSLMLLIPTICGDYCEITEKKYEVCLADSNCFIKKLSEMIMEKFLTDETYNDYIEWQKDYDLSDNDFQDYLNSAYNSYIESTYNNGFDEGFRQGYSVGELDTGKQLLNYKKHIVSVLLMSGKLTEKDITDISLCEPDTINEIKNNIERNDKAECQNQSKEVN